MMMAGPYAGTLSDLPTVRDEVTCSINAENPTGAKGFGCRETGPLGPSRKATFCGMSPRRLLLLRLWTKLRCILRAYCGGAYTRHELLFHDAVS